jgi:Cof subfamily protein (haloacid dehalogenase superfamily)
MQNGKNIDPGRIKALALDLDGTALRPDTTLSKRTVKTLKSFMDRGKQIIICTGRAVEAAERFRLDIGTEGPMVYYNGAEVVDMPSGRVIRALPLGLDVVDFCTGLSRTMGVHFHVFFPAGTEGGKEILMAEQASAEAAMYHRHTGISAVIGNIKEAIKAPGLSGCIKCMFITEPEILEKIRSGLTERFGDSIYVAKTFPTFLEVMAAGVSKGEGLKAAMNKRGIKAEEVIALGDEENDLPMFSAAGFSAAPAGAREKVRDAADFVIGSNAEDGAAAFLEQLFGLTPPA